jgi:hypothetical protein
MPNFPGESHSAFLIRSFLILLIIRIIAIFLKIYSTNLHSAKRNQLDKRRRVAATPEDSGCVSEFANDSSSSSSSDLE